MGEVPGLLALAGEMPSLLSLQGKTGLLVNQTLNRPCIVLNSLV
jgi:hypothetical protein